MLAYNDEVRLMTLSIADGLAGETVNRVMKDHAGRIWIATNNGVNIYNGRGIATFRLAQEKQLTVNVNDLCETADGSIFAATDAGLYRRGTARRVSSISCLRCRTRSVCWLWATRSIWAASKACKCMSRANCVKGTWG